MERSTSAKLDRRKFLRLAGTIIGTGMMATAATPFSGLLPGKAYAAAPDELETAILGDYLARIEPIRQKFSSVVEENDIFSGFKSFTTESRSKDFQGYFPMYWGAQLVYQTPWLLLWIMHAHETAISRDLDADLGWQKGAMQRDFRYYSNEVAARAVQGWSVLRWLPQRYVRGSRWQTTDYEEIFFAAWKLNRDAQMLRELDANLSFKDSILNAQYHYCAKEFAKERIAKYGEIAPLFALE